MQEDKADMNMMFISPDYLIIAVVVRCNSGWNNLQNWNLQLLYLSYHSCKHILASQVGVDGS